jgi:preprotein translocase subunit SecD
VPPPSTTTSRPGRLLAALVLVLIVLLVSVLGGSLASPSHWHKRFQVGLGLDLSWGTQITLQAYRKNNNTPVDQGAMAKARQIIENRIDGDGFTNASVVQQNSNEIVVSVPHENAQQVANLVGTTATLSFRQLLLEAPNTTTGTTTTPAPSSSPSPSSSSSPSPSASSSSSPKATTSPTPSTSTSSKASSSGTGQAVGASVLAAGGSAAKPKASSSPSSSPSPSTSPSSSSTKSTKPTLSTTADGTGDAAELNSQTITDFDRLNCADRNWQAKIYGSNPSYWARPTQQAVGCQRIALEGGTSVWYKYAMSPAIVQGTDLSSVTAETQTDASGYVVAFNVRSGPAQKLGTTTTKMQSLYDGGSGSAENTVLGTLAIVLDGQIQETPVVQTAFSSSGEIQGPQGVGFSQAQADNLANLLKYGSLPLSFKTLDSSSVSPQLGSAQLSAGIIAGIVGLILVVIYSFIYYRGLALVSVSSLAIAAAITYLTVVLLSRYEHFNLTLAGIAGLIVAIGITADSFVVYFERLRDEVREGRSLRAAVERGWARARRTILVSDTVSFLAALLLYIFAIGDVRGFAFTLGLTTLVDVVVVFLFTKPMITLLARTKFYGQGHKLSGLDPERLGMRSRWRGSRTPAAPAGGASASANTPKEA